MIVYPSGFSEKLESNPYVIWFREQNLQKGQQLPSREESMKELKISATTLSHAYSYLWGSTGEIGWEENGDGHFVKENGVKYVPSDGWYLNSKLIAKCRKYD